MIGGESRREINELSDFLRQTAYAIQVYLGRGHLEAARVSIQASKRRNLTAKNAKNTKKTAGGVKSPGRINRCALTCFAASSLPSKYLTPTPSPLCALCVLCG